MAKTLNFTMHSGDSKNIIVTVKDENDAVVDITGATVDWQMARSQNSATPDLVKSTTGGNGITLTDPVNGVFTVALDATDSDDFIGAYYHEAQVTDAGGKISTVIIGTITVLTDLI